MTRRYKDEKWGIVKMKLCYKVTLVTNMLQKPDAGGGHLFQCNTQRCRTRRVVVILIGYVEG